MGVSYPQTDVSILGSNVSIAGADVSLPPPNDVSIVSFFDPSALAIFSAFSPAPTPARQVLINNLVVGLKQAGVWSLLDVLYIFAASTSADALINWIKPGTFTATLVSAPTFTQDRGFTGSGANDIDSGWNFLTNGVQYKLNSAHVAAWTAVAATSHSGLTGSASGTANTAILPSFGGSFYAACNDAAFPSGVTNLVTTGFFLANRSGVNAQQGYINGSLVGSSTDTSGAVPNSDLFGLQCAGFDLYDGQINTLSAGGSLTPAQVAAYYGVLNTYLTAVGA